MQEYYANRKHIIRGLIDFSYSRLSNQMKELVWRIVFFRNFNQLGLYYQLGENEAAMNEYTLFFIRTTLEEQWAWN